MAATTVDFRAYARNCPFFNPFAGDGGFFRRAQNRQKRNPAARSIAVGCVKDNIIVFTLMMNINRTMQQMITNLKTIGSSRF